MGLRDRFYEAVRAHWATVALRDTLNGLLDKVREDSGARPSDGREGPGSTASGSSVPGSPEVGQAYANLELPYGAALPEVKKQYRRLMGKYHPDKHHREPLKADVANELAAELTRAYDTIVAWLERRQ